MFASQALATKAASLILLIIVITSVHAGTDFSHSCASEFGPQSFFFFSFGLPKKILPPPFPVQYQ